MDLTMTTHIKNQQKFNNFFPPYFVDQHNSDSYGCAMSLKTKKINK